MESKETLEKLTSTQLAKYYKFKFGVPPTLKNRVDMKEKLIECIIKDKDAYTLGYGNWVWPVRIDEIDDQRTD